MLHVLQLVYQAEVSAQAFVVLDEVFFEIHDVIVGSFFCTVDVDASEVLVVNGLNQGKAIGVRVVFMD